MAGIDFHVGSQLTEIAPFVAALDKSLELVDALEREGIALHHIDLGGGLGIRYRDERPPSPAEYLGAAARPARRAAAEAPARAGPRPGRQRRRAADPGGVPEARPERNFAIVDAAMNDLLRPALYDAWHDIVPVLRVGAAARPSAAYEVVGPVCETGDFLGRGRPLALVEGDLLAILSAGAYGMVMSSNYNTRPRAAEVMVDGSTAHLVREPRVRRSLALRAGATAALDRAH